MYAACLSSLYQRIEAFQQPVLYGTTLPTLESPTDEKTDLSDFLFETPPGKTLLVFGTYAADFNAIEYGQRLRYYLPLLRSKGVDRVGLALNAPPATLPAVVGGYLGNPFRAQPWIEDAFVVGTRKGRWPTNVVEIDSLSGAVQNKFHGLPLVGSWGRRPLELATLRLQNMCGISIAKWDKLAPGEEALACGVLTQLGGCLLVDRKNGNTLFEWRDPGICAVANFEDILQKLA